MNLTSSEEKVILAIRNASPYADIIVERRPTRQNEGGEIFAVEVKNRELLAYKKERAFT